jgi:hypothetical protein
MRDNIDNCTELWVTVMDVPLQNMRYLGIC